VIFHVINLDRSPERWDYMMRHLAERGLEARRIPAVDGRRYTPADLDRLNRPRPGRRRLAASEVACFESHRRAWAAIAEGAEPMGAVLEDDVWLAPATGRIVAAIAQSGLPLDLVKLNNYRKPVVLHAEPMGRIEGVALHKLPERTIDASAYLMSKAAAARALALHETFTAELDVALFDPEHGLAIVQVVPALSVQEKFADFRFLPPAASESLLELTRAEEQVRRKAERAPMSLGAKLAAELQRFRRRRLRPRIEALRNLARPPEARIAFRRVDYAWAGPEDERP
jgi:glycosyl transferase, family 25